MFKKLALRFNRDLAGEHCRGSMRRDFGVLRYYNMADSDRAVFGEAAFLFDLKPHSVRWVELDGKHGTLPHRDTMTTAAVNMYVQTGFAVTKFWEPNPGAELIDGNQYAFKDVQLRSSFRALPGDVYLLDNQQVHSVHCPTIKPRFFLQFSWNTLTFNDALSLINQGEYK